MSRWFTMLATFIFIYKSEQSSPDRYGLRERLPTLYRNVLWILLSDAQRRFLPADYGNGNSVYKRYARWDVHSVWQDRHEALADDPD